MNPGFDFADLCDERIDDLLSVGLDGVVHGSDLGLGVGLDLGSDVASGANESGLVIFELLLALVLVLLDFGLKIDKVIITIP